MSNVQPDPNYRQASAYEYGDLRDIRLHCHLSDAILWSYELPTPGGGKYICGGFSGPFEALAAALEDAKERRRMEN